MEQVTFDDPSLACALFGPQNLHLQLLSQASGATLSNRGSTLLIETTNANVRVALCKLFFELYAELKNGSPLDPNTLATRFNLCCHPKDTPIISLKTPCKIITGRNIAQQNYLISLKKYDIVFATGPAGTGKTYLAVSMAVQALTQHRCQKIILTRPAVEAGEKLGFLPGDLKEKINPYLHPLYDALYDMLPQPKVAALSELGNIEVAPLAFMRGRTLNDAYVILDEAQNTTHEQMKMFLTRMGHNSRMVITGDTTQIDLPKTFPGAASNSGLVHAMCILKGISSIAFHTFTKDDVVRHPLVREIVNAYDLAETKK